jgi:uncharacterized protein
VSETEGAALAVRVETIETPSGPARAHVHDVAAPRARLVLGHGAGGGIQARDLLAATAAALAASVEVALVEQPYRVTGRRSPPPARTLDAAWTPVVAALSAGTRLRLIVGGRSSGARVACRTAGEVGAAGVLCLAFPLQPRRRADSGRPAPLSRLPELEAVEVPVLIVQGENDPFGMPPSSPLRTVVPVRGDHSLRGDLEAVGGAVSAWLSELLSAAGGNNAAD